MTLLAVASHPQKRRLVVAVGISSTDVTAENYGYMAPIKAALEGCIRYLQNLLVPIQKFVSQSIAV